MKTSQFQPASGLINQFELTVSATCNSAKGQNTGWYKVDFKDGSKYSFYWPTVYVK